MAGMLGILLVKLGHVLLAQRVQHTLAQALQLSMTHLLAHLLIEQVLADGHVLEALLVLLVVDLRIALGTHGMAHRVVGLAAQLLAQKGAAAAAPVQRGRELVSDILDGGTGFRGWLGSGGLRFKGFSCLAGG